MKTALESLDALEALARKMAAMEIAPTALGMISGGLVYAPVEHYREARAIVAELPEPVDPDVALAKELAAIVAQYIDNPKAAEVYRNESRWDRGEPVSAIVAALRRAREEGVR